jgi:hypothetical protein
MKKIFAALLLLVLWSGLVSAQGTIECNPPAKGAGTQPGVCTGQFPLITTAAATIYQIDVTSAPVTNHVITWTNSGAPSGFSITVYAGTSGVATSLNTSTTIAGSYSFTGTYNWVGVAVTTLSSGGTQANYYGASPWIGLAASGGGWTRTGTDVALTTGTDTVHIQNTLTIANGLTVASTLTLGTSQAINYTTSLLFTSASTTNLTLSGGASPAAQFAGTLGVTGASTLSSTFTTPAAKFDSSLNTVFNVSGSLLAQNATAGFTYIPGVATGVPSGTPAISYTGAFPMVWDHTDKKLYAYDGSWGVVGGGGIINRTEDFITLNNCVATVGSPSNSSSNNTLVTAFPSASSSSITCAFMVPAAFDVTAASFLEFDFQPDVAAGVTNNKIGISIRYKDMNASITSLTAVDTITLANNTNRVFFTGTNATIAANVLTVGDWVEFEVYRDTTVANNAAVNLLMGLGRIKYTRLL